MVDLLEQVIHWKHFLSFEREKKERLFIGLMWCCVYKCPEPKAEFTLN